MSIADSHGKRCEVMARGGIVMAIGCEFMARRGIVMALAVSHGNRV